MRAAAVLLFLCWATKSGAVVTTEDIRIAILQMVNVARSTDDKLERHEFREKQLGEQLKKGLINIDKRIKLLDPLKGAVGRLDERLAAVETILLQKDKEDRDRQQILQVVLDIQKKMPQLLDQLNQDLTQKVIMSQPPAAISEPMMTKQDFVSMEKEVSVKIDEVQTTMKNMEEELAKLRRENLSDVKTNQSMEILEKAVKRQLDNSENLLAKYENKLAEYNNRIPELPTVDFKEQDEWKRDFIRALETQKTKITDLTSDVKLIQSQIAALPQKTDLEISGNLTLGKIEEIGGRKSASVNVANLERSLEEIKNVTLKNHEEVKSSFNELTEISSHLTESFATNYAKIINEVQSLSKMEQSIMQTADSVLDTRRRVEYGVHQIMAEIEKQIKASSGEISQGINDRFESFEMSILDEEYGALHNLTSKIQEEIGRVWRQIGIMHQQMSASTDTLNKLQNQTDAYVSGSLDVMDSMKGKVTQITGRMTEVDENLNFLLGKLSLLSQEFNRIKSGLGTTLDEIRSSFQKVQDKIKQDQGPGPHKISSNEIIETS